MAQNDIIRAAVISSSNSGNQWVNVLHTKVMETLADDFVTWKQWWESIVQQAFQAFMSEDCTVNAVQLTNLNDKTEFVYTFAVDGGEGARPGGYLPTFLCALCSTYSATLGKTRQGRHFFSGLTYQCQDDGNITQNQLALFDPIVKVLENTTVADPGTFKVGIYSSKDKTFYQSIDCILRPRIRRLTRRQLNYSVV